jgi:hypothetical protein
LDRVTAVGFDAVAGLLWDERRRDDPACVPFVAQITREPIAAGASFVDEDERMAFGLELADELVEVTLVRADRAEVDDLRAMVLGHVGDRNRLFVDLHSNTKGDGLGHG